MKEFKNESISLVKLNPQTNTLFVTNEAIKYLSTLTKPISIITIAGLYRTGKSFLVNKLVPKSYNSTGTLNYSTSQTNTNQDCPFKIGTTTQSMTKGLNILATPITIECGETGQEIDYLLVDSQGIGSCERSGKYDMDLLILIFLISSTVVYNSMGPIDQQTLEQLQVVLKLKNCVAQTQHKYDQCSFKYSSPPPKFFWILRDFALQLTDKTGQELTPDQYLQQCLQQSPNPTNNPQTRKKNQIRKAIKENLGERHCYTLVRPTIRQEDLHSLARSGQVKIRSQFVGQVEGLKEALFGGTLGDVKRINGRGLDGKVFAKVLTEYVEVINRDQLPKVNDIWNSVLKTNNEQYFQQLSTRLKKQIKTLKLPLAKQQLKLKLNQIQNRYYKQMQKTMEGNAEELKLYNKQYLLIVQKLNKQLRERNDLLRVNGLILELQGLVKQEVRYDQLKPYELVQPMKHFLQRIKLKIKGQQQGYEYLLTILTDIFFIIEQKSAKQHRQLKQTKQHLQSTSLDKSNLELNLISIKRQYHQALKTIQRLQEGQADIDRNYVLSKNKVIGYESKIIGMEVEMKREREECERGLREMQEKYKGKIQEMGTQIKRYKSANSKLEEQLSQLREKVSEHTLITKKQQIFAQKIKQSFDKFNEQRQTLTKQIDIYKKQITQCNQKYKQIKQIYEKQVQKQKITQQNYIKKQQNLMKQFDNLKQCIKDTKASFQQTSKTMISSQQVLKQVGNLSNVGISTHKKQKYQTPAKQRGNTFSKNTNNINKVLIQQKEEEQSRIQNENQNSSRSNNRAVLKKFYQLQIEKLKQQHKTQVENLNQTITKLQDLTEKLKLDKQVFQIQAKQYKQKCLKLQSDIIQANAKFNEFLKEIQLAKQKQRMLYEESIVRLLNNIDRRQNDRQKDKTKQRNSLMCHSAFYQQRNSLYSTQSNSNNANLTMTNFNKTNKNTQIHKDSLSFGNIFKTG